MTPVDRFLFAPELIVVELVDAAVAALERALYVEHPLVNDRLPTEHPPVRHHARAVLRQADRLRTALRTYRRVVDDVLREAEQHESPF
jgi:hypothetical protein